LLIPGALLAYALTGTVPIGPAMLLPLVVSLAAGAALLLGVQILVGLATAWLGTSRPLFFIVQKLTFVFGGLVLPLDAYPPAVAAVSAWTPFPAMLYAPASIALESSPAHVAAVLGLQAFWLGAVWLCVAWAGAAFERRLVREGVAS
jgi:ABC-2 type transport system permease protein